MKLLRLWSAVLLCCLVMSVGSTIILRKARVGVDDAYISYRYASNLVGGFGLVYNPGERVEGYTNLLYVLLMACGLLLTDAYGIFPFSFLVNLVFACCSLGIFFWWLRREYGERVALAGAIVFACNMSFYYWVSSGMETIPVLFIQLLIWMATEIVCEKPLAKGWWTLLCVATIVSVLMRADGFTVPLFALAYLICRNEWKRATSLAAVLAITATGLILWRYQYYGYTLPNTYYAKVDVPPAPRMLMAVKLLLTFSFPTGLFLPIIALFASAVRYMIAAGRGFRPSAIPSKWFHVLLGLGLVVYWIYVGGDHYNERFLLLLFPLGFVGCLGCRYVATSRWALAALTAVIVLLQMRPFDAPHGWWRPLSGQYSSLPNAGELLGKTYPGATMATDVAGMVPYYSRLWAVDIVGLTDVRIAHGPAIAFEQGWARPGHLKADIQYTLSLRPTMIVCWIYWRMVGGILQASDAYAQAGYKLKYLVNMTPDYEKGKEIVDVENLRSDDVQQLVSEGYRLGVLLKMSN
jgi:arabinofuranosyltransferase